MLDKKFKRESNLRRYERLFKSTGDYQWLLKYAEESDFSSDPMSNFDVPTVKEYSRYLAYANNLDEEDAVQKRLGQALTNGLISFWTARKMNDKPALVTWKYDHPKKMLAADLLPETPEDLDYVVEQSYDLVQDGATYEDRKVRNLLKDRNKVSDGIGYALVRAQNPFYEYFVYKNPLVDLLPQEFGSEDEAYGSLPLALSAHLQKVAAKKKWAPYEKIIRSFSGPRLDDLVLAYQVAQVKMLTKSGELPEKDLSRFQVINDGFMQHAKRGLEAQQQFMNNPENRYQRYVSTLTFDYELKEGDTFESVVSDFDGNIEGHVELNKKSFGDDFDPGDLRPGDVIKLSVGSDLLTDNMFVGQFQSGKSYGSLSDFVRPARKTPPQSDRKTELKKPLEESKLLYYKDWRGTPTFYSRPLPKGSEFTKAFIEGSVADDLQKYSKDLNVRLVESVIAAVKLYQNGLNEGTQRVKNIAEHAFSGNTTSALSAYGDFLKGVQDGLENAVGSVEGDLIGEFYSAIINDVLDKTIQRYSGGISNPGRFKELMQAEVPFELKAADMSHVVSSSGKSKISSNALSSYQKNALGSGAVLDVLKDSRGLLIEKYQQNEKEYKEWHLNYGGGKDGQAKKAVQATLDKVDNELYARLGIPTDGSAKDFAAGVCDMLNKYRDLESLKDVLEDIPPQSLFIDIDKRMLNYFEEIKYNVAAAYPKTQVAFSLGDMGYEGATGGGTRRSLFEEVGFEEEGEVDQPRAGGTEGRLERGQRIYDSADSDVRQWFESLEENAGQSFKRNGEVHTRALGTLIQTFYSQTTGGAKVFESLGKIREGDVGQLIRSYQNTYRFAFGRENNRAKDEDFKSYVISQGSSEEDMMERVGAFADPLQTALNMRLKKGAMSILQRLQREYEDLETRKVQGDENVSDAMLLDKIDLIEKQEKIVQSYSYDSARNAYKRAFSFIPQSQPQLVEGMLADYFANKKEALERELPQLSKSIVPFKKNDPITAKPFSYPQSPYHVSEEQVDEIFNNVFGVEGDLVTPIETIMVRMKNVVFDDKKIRSQLNALSKAMSKHIIGKLQNRPGFDLGVELAQVEKIMEVMPYIETEGKLEKLKPIAEQVLSSVLAKVKLQAEEAKGDLESYLEALPDAPVFQEYYIGRALQEGETKVSGRASAYRYLRESGLSEEDLETLYPYVLNRGQMPEEAFRDTSRFMSALNQVVQDKELDVDAEKITQMTQLVVDPVDEEEADTSELDKLKEDLNQYKAKHEELSQIDIDSMDIESLGNALGELETAVSEMEPLQERLNKLTDSEYDHVDPEYIYETFFDVIQDTTAKVQNAIMTLHNQPVSLREDEPAEEEVISLDEGDFDLLEDMDLSEMSKEELENIEQVIELGDEDLQPIEPEDEELAKEKVVQEVAPETPDDSQELFFFDLDDQVDKIKSILENLEDDPSNIMMRGLELLSHIESVHGEPVTNQEAYRSIKSMIDGLAADPSYSNLVQFFVSNYEAARRLVSQSIENKKTSGLEMLSDSRYFTLKTSVEQEDDDFYYY